MGRFGKKDPNLTEVKAVLQRLQGFPEDGEPTAALPATTSVPARLLGTPFLAGAVIGTAAIGVLGIAVLFGFGSSSTAPSNPEPVASIPAPAARSIEPQTVKGALELARSLMGQGQVRAAREKLLVLAKQGSPDAAWDVARSYDPNVLATVPNPDSAADIAEATRWYRTWYGAAVKEGLVADSVPIERIIGSMKK